jgi:RES domain-containing protein
MAGAASGLEPATAPVVLIRARTHRLIASRWPTIGVFETVASPEDLEAALHIETLTNDRVTETLARLGRLDRSEWVIDQPGATLVMAAFLHPAPGGGRFTTDALGAWYCATELETAIAETVYHHTNRLAHSMGGFRHVIQMRQLISDIAAELHDIRPLRTERPDFYDPESYEASQPFGEALRRAGSNGILFASVRRAGGTNLAVFRPPLVPPVLQGDHFDYRWTGEPVPEVVRLTSAGATAASARG